VIADFRSEADEKCALLGYYAASSGNLLPTFRDNLSVPSSGFKNHTLASFFLILGKTVFLDRPQEAKSGWEICDNNNNIIIIIY
jgi:hypothetical protein